MAVRGNPEREIRSCEANRSHRLASRMNLRIAEKTLMLLFGGFRSDATLSQPEPRRLVLEQLPVPRAAAGAGVTLTGAAAA